MSDRDRICLELCDEWPNGRLLDLLHRAYDAGAAAERGRAISICERYIADYRSDEDGLPMARHWADAVEMVRDEICGKPEAGR